jgi:transcriptional regulator with XRE-family HTH domain
MIVTGEIIRVLRNLRGVKQQTLAGKLGISQQAYSKIEKSNCVESFRAESILKLLDSTSEDLETITKLNLGLSIPVDGIRRLERKPNHK